MDFCRRTTRLAAGAAEGRYTSGSLTVAPVCDSPWIGVGFHQYVQNLSGRVVIQAQLDEALKDGNGEVDRPPLLIDPGERAHVALELARVDPHLSTDARWCFGVKPGRGNPITSEPLMATAM